MGTLDVLVAARAEVEKNWGQGTQNVSTLEGAPVCASLAIWRVAPYCQWEEAYNTLQALLPEGVRVPHFNDDPSTTKEMVLALYDRAIAIEAGEELSVSDPAHVHFQVA